MEATVFPKAFAHPVTLPCQCLVVGSVAHRPTVSAPPGGWLEMWSLRPHQDLPHQTPGVCALSWPLEKHCPGAHGGRRGRCPIAGSLGALGPSPLPVLVRRVPQGPERLPAQPPASLLSAGLGGGGSHRAFSPWCCL